VSLDEPEPAPTDGNVVLRRWTMADLGCVRSVSEEGRIQEHTSSPERFAGENGRAWVRRQQERARSSQGWSLAIGDALTGEALGCIVLMLRPQAGVAGIGYWLAPEARNSGYATRAVRLLSDWGLKEQRLHRSEAWVEPGNDASVRVLSKCGFEYEGRLPSFLQFPTRRADALVFSRTRRSVP
jgi:[ribosomal protein S5]-alanine N-acetyltransferase